jgi:predicted phage terminase large subunit-like protein|tara:strand:- start:3041 stop:4507 length:1467 start_codon:yes stop_codon:yes gene_type:complete
LNLQTLPEEALKEILALTEAKRRLDLREEAQEKFLPFVHHVYDNFIEGSHHRVIAKKLEAVARGEIKRLIINMPPRHSKSEFASYLMPAWFLGRNPKLKIIQATHNTELAVRFGRKVRDLIDDPEYKAIFPNTNLKEDNKGAGTWGTDKGAEYFAAGVGAAITGRGADLLVIDDPHSEQDALSSTAFDHAYEWYTSGPRQRLQPGGAIIIVMTRWGKKDLTGQLLSQQKMDRLSDQWDVVEFPAIMPSDKPLWPEFWDKEALLSIKASLPVAKWQAQWQQNPTSSESAIIKREWWKDWEKEKIPRLEYVLQAYDTAFSKKQSADYSAITTWGVFKPEDSGPDNIILMDARRGRWNFPELKDIAYEEHEYWEPDMVIVEAKATGQPLIDELRLKGIPALGFSPGKGSDKVTRMHMVAPLFEAGMVWAPMKEKFSDEVIEEIVSFPNGDHDDFCDSMTLALMRFRQGGFIALDGEEEDEPEWRPRQREYY